MEPQRVRYLVAAVFLFGLAGYNFLTYTIVTSQQSTFNLQPGLVEDFTVTRNPSDGVTGSFSETSGHPVSVFIQTSAQFAAFQSQVSFSSLYNVTNVASGIISYTFQTQDTYYILFRHGTGLTNTTETVYFQRNYQVHDNFRLGLGFAFVALGALDLGLAFRRRKPMPTPAPIPQWSPPPPTPPPQ